jgi:Mg-chelatase subunit ChlI
MTEAATSEEATIVVAPTMSAVSILTSLTDYAEAHSDGRRHQQAAAWNLTKARRVVAARTLGSVLRTTNATLTAQSIVRPLLNPTRTVKINTAAAAATSSKMMDADEIELWNETTVEPKTAKMTKKDASSTDTTTTTPFVPIFSLIDPTSAQSDDNETGAHETEEDRKENQGDDDDGFGETTTLHDGNNNMSTTTGLRQRKAAAANASSKEWKIEKPAIVESQLSAQSTTTTTATTATATTTVIRSRSRSSSPEMDLLVALFGTTTTMLSPAELRQAQTQAVAALQTYCRAATHVAAILAALSWSEKQMTNDNNNNPAP